MLIGQGIYGIPEASRLTGVHPQTARRWFVGTLDREPLLEPSAPKIADRYAINFLDLIDLLVVGQFRDAEVSFKTIRRSYEVLQQRFDTKHAFCHRSLLTDGTKIFLDHIDEIGDHFLEEVISRQHAMPKVLRQYLKEIEYDHSSELARLWNIGDGVILDPARNFGKPIVAEGVSTSVILDSVNGNHGNVELVADLYGVSMENVKKAVLFEEKLAA